MYFHIIDRATAKSRGLKRYFTGEPCVRGVFWERRTSSLHCLCEKCKTAIAKQSKRYRGRNSEKIKARWINDKEQLTKQHKQWYSMNKEYVIEKARERRNADPDKYKQKQRDIYHRNRLENIKRGKLYREENRALINAKASTNRAKSSNAVPSWYGELDEFVLIQAYELRELRKSSTNFEWCVDHMIPINGFNFVGLHVWSNFQVIPSYLNDAKGNNLVFTQPTEWLEYLCQQNRPH